MKLPCLLVLSTLTATGTPPIDMGNLGVVPTTPAAPAEAPMVTLPESLAKDFDGTLPITNRHPDRSLDQIIFTWKLLRFPPAGSQEDTVTAAVGKVHLPGVQAQADATLKLPLPGVAKDADALRIFVNEFNGTLITSRTWPFKTRRELLHQPAIPASALPPQLLGENPIRIQSGGAIFTFATTTGQLSGITVEGTPTGPVNGPRLANSTPGDPVTVAMHHSDNRITIKVGDKSNQNKFRWIVLPGSRLQLDYRFARSAEDDQHLGPLFDLPPDLESKRWLGLHPDPGIRSIPSGDPDFHGPCEEVLWLSLDHGDHRFTIIPGNPDMTIGLAVPAAADQTTSKHRLFFSRQGSSDSAIAGSLMFCF